METNRRASDLFLEHVTKIVYSILRKEKLLQSEFHIGKVEEVISDRQLSVFVDGSNTSQKIKCNPDVTFTVNDQVIVIFINNNPNSKYVLSRIAF
jgi:hypothetical protein